MGCLFEYFKLFKVKVTLNPLVSVIIPCYNVEKYVSKAISSILSQTYTNIELWIIDDASTDKTLEVINSFSDPRINAIIFAENTSKIRAVNEVLKKVNGDFICFQDADDWSCEKKIELQVKEFIQDPHLGICLTNYRYANKITESYPIAITDEQLKDEFLNFRHKENKELAPSMCATMMITQKVLRKFFGYNPFFKGRVAEDIHWLYRILKFNKGISIPEVLYFINLREASLTGYFYSGKNAKAAYSWQLLAKIIHKDIYENIDVLDAENVNELKALELQACEEALVEQIQLNHKIIAVYENSTSFKIGKIVLTPFKKLSGLRKYFK